MGAILVVFGEAGDPELAERLERMIAVSPYRGTAERMYAAGAAMAIQTLGWDASIAKVGDLIVAFHGFIGNWDELGVDSDGAAVEAPTQAERLAFWFQRYDRSVFGKLRGEFACVVWRISTRTANVCRDIAGRRPLFISETEAPIVMATAPRLVLAGAKLAPVLNRTVLVDHILDQYNSKVDSLFRGVKHVFPEWLYEIRPRRTPAVRTEVRWVPPEQDLSFPGRPEDLGRELAGLVLRAVQRSLPSEPFSLALSSGHDSGLLWGCIGQLSQQGICEPGLGQAISFSLPGLSCDETARVGALLRATGGSGTILDASAVRVPESASAIDKLLDCPGFPTLCLWNMLSRDLRASGTRILMTGGGGDTFFTGSPGVLPDVVAHRGLVPYAVALSRARDLSRRARFVQPMTSMARAIAPRWVARPWRLRHRPPWLAPECWREWAEKSGGEPEGRYRLGRIRRRSLLAGLRQLQVGPIPQYWDQVCGAAGVEVRQPYVDQDLIEFAFRIPSEVMGTWGSQRRLVRVAARTLMPADLVGGFQKVAYDDFVARDVGFIADDWEARGWDLVDRGVLDREGIDTLVQTSSIEMRNAVRLVRLFQFEVFVRRLERSLGKGSENEGENG